MEEKPTCLLVGGGDVTELQAAVTRRGARAMVITTQDGLARILPGPVVVHAEAVDFAQPMGVVRRLLELHKKWNFQAIVPVSEVGLHAASLVASQLKLPALSLKAVQNTRDKVRMRKVLEQEGLGQVRYALCATLEQAGEFLRSIGGPIIVKPHGGTGSDGVSKVNSPAELASAFKLAMSARFYHGGILCEEFVEGPEVSVEGYSVNGQFVPVAITDKMTDEHFLEIGHNQPSQHAPEVQQAAFEFTAKALAALGAGHGVSHTELKLTPRGPVMIETHTRMGGDSIHVLTERTTGVDLADVMVGMAFGEEPRVRPQRTGRAAAIRFKKCGRDGRVAQVQIPPIEPGGLIESADVYLRPGEQVTSRSSSLDRLGQVIAVGPEAENVGLAAERFLDRIHVSIEEGAPWTAPAA